MRYFLYGSLMFESMVLRACQETAGHFQVSSTLQNVCFGGALWGFSRDEFTINVKQTLLDLCSTNN